MTGIAQVVAAANTGVEPGQQAYTTAGTYSWTAPYGVTSVCVVCVGGGGGIGGLTQDYAGGGGGLGWKNNIAVIPGNTYTVVVGANEQNSYFINTSTVAGLAGTYLTGGGYVGDGGGNGGSSLPTSYPYTYGGAGAGGYSGNGGDQESSGSGGGGGGGARHTAGLGGALSSGGGGVGILGEGASGAGSTNPAVGGGGGSGGSDGSGGATFNSGSGGAYGGGGGDHRGVGAGGAVRIIWAGTRPGDVSRSFPSTNTGDL